MKVTMVFFVIVLVIVAFFTFYIQPKDERPTSFAPTTAPTATLQR